MPTRIDAVYRVVTPMFCGGADPERAELRLSSFKGTLRYWWRALAWQRYDGDLVEIRKREDLLFGSAGGGRSSVTMRLESAGGLARVSADEELTVGNEALDRHRRHTRNATVGLGVRYLGYGVMKHTGQLTRECLQAPFEFRVRMRVRHPNRGREVTSVAGRGLLRDALTAVGVFGGVGAKSRKGFGSLVLRSLTVDGRERWNPPRSEDELVERIERLRPDGMGDRWPEYTAFSARARHVLVLSRSESREPLELLDLIGRELVRYRSWGRNGRILRNEKSERNFASDHDLMKRRNRNTHPERIAFGLPHNYGPRTDQQVGPQGLDRRASPLFIHVHECAGRPVAVLSFLPARFLPEGRSVISVGRQHMRQQSERDLYRPIHEFFDRLLGRGPTKLREALEAIEVKPR